VDGVSYRKSTDNFEWKRWKEWKQWRVFHKLSQENLLGDFSENLPLPPLPPPVIIFALGVMIAPLEWAVVPPNPGNGNRHSPLFITGHQKSFVRNGGRFPSIYEVVTSGSSHDDEVPPELAATAE
jgi:hypothetical protein